MIDFLLLLLGIALGAFAGLIPGIHANTLISLLANFGGDAGSFGIALAALAAANVVFAFLPAIFFCIPDAETIVSVLPGQRLLLEGKGFRAVNICVYAALIALILSLLLLPLSFSILPALYALVAPNMLLVLGVLSLFLLASEREPKKIALAALVFLLAGVLGALILDFPLVEEPLFPAFSGLFAVAGILVALGQGVKIPIQREESGRIGRGLLACVFAGVILGMLADLLPGISSPAQIAVFASAFIFLDSEKFLALCSSVAVSHLVFSLGAVSSIGKARTGVAIALGALPEFQQNLWLYIGATAVGIALSAVLLLVFARVLVNLLKRVESEKINLLILAYLLAMVALTSGANGLLIAATAGAIGVLPPLLGVRRTHLMGAILLPSLLSRLGMMPAIFL
ncbi:MAG: tripartite tricarboxylate transporter permease [Candidatus Micrarchaeota archaeon]